MDSPWLPWSPPLHPHHAIFSPFATVALGENHCYRSGENSVEWLLTNQPNSRTGALLPTNSVVDKILDASGRTPTSEIETWRLFVVAHQHFISHSSLSHPLSRAFPACLPLLCRNLVQVNRIGTYLFIDSSQLAVKFHGSLQSKTAKSKSNGAPPTMISLQAGRSVGST